MTWAAFGPKRLGFAEDNRRSSDWGALGGVPKVELEPTTNILRGARWGYPLVRIPA